MKKVKLTAENESKYVSEIKLFVRNRFSLFIHSVQITTNGVFVVLKG